MNSTVILNHGFSLPPARPARREGRPRRLSGRAYRKALRAAELAAWNAADRTSPVVPTVTRPPAERSESALFLILGLAVVLALVLAGISTSEWAENSESLRNLVLALTR